MRRFHLFEIEDQRWCPAVIRGAATDYLRFVEEVGRPYAAIVPRLRRALERAGTREIVDLCSGSGGPWFHLSAAMEAEGYPVRVVLTDRYPNLDGFARMAALSGGRVAYRSKPVDAVRVPGDLEGFRTLFSGFHHFRSAEARAILGDAAASGRGIGVFEATQRRAAVIALMFAQPLAVWIATPFIRPFRWSRLLWTYLLPVVPFLVLFDGVVSCLRTYTPADLRAMTRGLGPDGYVWEIGEQPIPRSPVALTYLLGYPEAGHGTGEDE